MNRPIALLTDFGTQDAYVGIMKAVILTRHPQARMFDLTHEIPPQDVLAGSLALASAAAYCPTDTVFLTVVDPGVGGPRRPLCIRSGGRHFVGPDNGLILPAASHVGTPEAFHLDRPEHWLPQPGATFHGRDVFAPVAAALSTGATAEEVGTRVTDPASLPCPRPTRDGTVVRGSILYIDHFGNAVTNLRPEDLDDPPYGALRFQVRSLAIQGPVKYYGEGAPGTPIILLGSWGYFEVAMNGGNAALLLGLQRGEPVTVTLPGR